MKLCFRVPCYKRKRNSLGRACWLNLFYNSANFSLKQRSTTIVSLNQERDDLLNMAKTANTAYVLTLRDLENNLLLENLYSSRKLYVNRTDTCNV